MKRPGQLEVSDSTSELLCFFSRLIECTVLRREFCRPFAIRCAHDSSSPGSYTAESDCQHATPLPPLASSSFAIPSAHQLAPHFSTANPPRDSHSRQLTAGSLNGDWRVVRMRVCKDGCAGAPSESRCERAQSGWSSVSGLEWRQASHKDLLQRLARYG